MKMEKNYSDGLDSTINFLQDKHAVLAVLTCYSTPTG